MGYVENSGSERTFVNRLAWDQNWIAFYRVLIASVFGVLLTMLGFIGHEVEMTLRELSTRLDGVSVQLGNMATSVALGTQRVDQFDRRLSVLQTDKNVLQDRVRDLELKLRH